MGEVVAAIKTLQVTPSSVSFPGVSVGNTDYNGARINVVNSGTVPVTFKSFTITGAKCRGFQHRDRLLPELLAGLNPGNSCYVYLNFTPTATGARSAELDINSDATNGKQQVQVSGTGI